MPSGETRNDQAARASWTTVPTGNSTLHGRPFPGSRTTASSFVPAIQSASTIPSSRSRRAPPASGTLASVRAPNARSTFCGPKRTAISFDGEIERILPACSDRSRASRPSARPRKTLYGVSVPARAVYEALAVGGEPRRRHGAVSERHPGVSGDGGLTEREPSVPTHTRLVSAIGRNETGQHEQPASSAGEFRRHGGAGRIQPQSMRALSRGRARFASDPFLSFARHRSITRSSGGEMPGCRLAAGKGCAPTMAAISAERVFPANGRRPVIIS